MFRKHKLVIGKASFNHFSCSSSYINLKIRSSCCSTRTNLTDKLLWNHVSHWEQYRKFYNEEGLIDSVKTLKKIIFLTLLGVEEWVGLIIFVLNCTVKLFCARFCFGFVSFFLQKILCNSISKAWTRWQDYFLRVDFGLLRLLETNNPRLQ